MNVFDSSTLLNESISDVEITQVSDIFDEWLHGKSIIIGEDYE